MARHDRSAEVIDLVQSLMTAPGLEALNIIARAFPRTGPAEPGTGYRASVLRFRPHEIPAHLQIPSDVEEINIALLGAVLEARQRQQLVEHVRSSVYAAGAGGTWDFRADFPPGVSDGSVRYELTVFTA